MFIVIGWANEAQVAAPRSTAIVTVASGNADRSIGKKSNG